MSKGSFLIALIVVLGFIGINAMFTMNERQQGLVLQFGEPKRVIQNSGLHFKLPIIQNTVKYDKRILEYDLPIEEVIAVDKKRMLIDSFTRFKIVDPLEFYKTVGTESNVRNRLNSNVISSLRRVVGRVTLDELLSIYRELPKPLQFTRDDFIESIRDPETILNMLRIGNSSGRIIGFAKGGPLEKYNFDLDFEDRNRGKNNTVFLEPVAIKNGYWGFHGGRELRQLFMMQVESKGYKFMTSFAMRDVIDERKENDKNVVFVKKFNPERWDYFRVTL